jgi:hypothetical protein
MAKSLYFAPATGHNLRHWTGDWTSGGAIGKELAMVIWITGRPGSGKTTMGRILRQWIGEKAILLDGDELRLATGYKDFSREGRDRWVMMVAGTAQVLEREGKSPIVCLVSPYSRTRQEARKNFRESFLIYMKADGDEEKMWPGSTYEEPVSKEHAWVIKRPNLPKDLIKRITGREPKKKFMRIEQSQLLDFISN